MDVYEEQASILINHKVLNSNLNCINPRLPELNPPHPVEQSDQLLARSGEHKSSAMEI